MKKVKLVDICKIQYGFAFDSSLFSNSNNGMPLIRIRDVVRGFTNTYTSEAFIEDYVVNKGDLLIGMDGEFNIAEWQSEKALLNQRVCKLIPSSTVGKRYIYYSLIKILKQIEEKTAFVTVKHLSAKELNKVEIPLPSLEEQKAIAGKLDKVSGLIEKRKTQLEKLDLLIKSRFIEMFGDPIHNEKHWFTASVESVCSDIYGGGTPSKAHHEYYENGDIPWVSSKDMKTAVLYDSQIRINQLGVDNSTAKIVPINSVIMVIRSGILKHTLPVAINAVPITVNQDLKVFVPSDRITSFFLMHLFKMLEKDILSGVRAVTADNIEFNSLKERKIIVPPIELQEKFATFVEQVDKSKFEIQKSLEKLEILKKSLMQQYFG